MERALQLARGRQNRAIHELGWVEGQNLAIEARWAEGRYDRLPALMVEVIGRQVDVLVTYGTPAAIAAKKATSTVPIVVAVMTAVIGILFLTASYYLARVGFVAGVSVALTATCPPLAKVSQANISTLPLPSAACFCTCAT